LNAKWKMDKATLAGGMSTPLSEVNRLLAMGSGAEGWLGPVATRAWGIETGIDRVGGVTLAA